MCPEQLNHALDGALTRDLTALVYVPVGRRKSLQQNARLLSNVLPETSGQFDEWIIIIIIIQIMTVQEQNTV